MQTLIDYADRSNPVSPSTTGGQIYERFLAEPDTFAVAVVGEDGRPVGLVDRNAFFLRMGAEYGRALYGHRPATFVMEAPRIEKAETPVMAFLEHMISSDRAALVKGFVVVDQDGRFLAVLTPLSLIESGYQAAKAQVRDLARQTRKLADAEREARAGSRAKSQFLAIMSHEIRTPLNGVLAIAEIIDRKLTQEALRPYVRTIIDSGQSLHRLLSDALDLSRAEAGAMDLTPAPVELRRLTDDLEMLWRPLAEQKGLELRVVVAGEMDEVVLVDAVRFKQVLNNLVGNALKFTGRGRVVVRFSAAGEGDAVRIGVEVEDTGSGIPADQLERVFEPFAKTDEHNGGAGLGLPICRQIVHDMGGEISVASTLGRGSVFAFSLRAPRSVGAAVQLASPVSSQTIEAGPGRVLIVDDNATNRLVASAFLDLFGLSHVFACDGMEAVELASAEAFDLILMDVKMPRMGGVEAARVIRALHGPNSGVPILAVTANADPVDAAAYCAAGMNGVVEKPLRAESLLSAISRALEPAVKAA